MGSLETRAITRLGLVPALGMGHVMGVRRTYGTAEKRLLWQKDHPGQKGSWHLVSPPPRPLWQGGSEHKWVQ